MSYTYYERCATAKKKYPRYAIANRKSNLKVRSCAISNLICAKLKSKLNVCTIAGDPEGMILNLGLLLYTTQE